ncbi:arginine--tRNA ligase [Betaproteobacteria bacterium]|nr:arginine--tRNA ligase [Betaproteobacteria bacterium]
MINLLKGNIASEILSSMDYLKDLEQIPRVATNFQDIEVSLEIPKNKANGDLSSNIALKKSRETDLDALKLANLIVETLKSHLTKDQKSQRLWDSVNVAKPGFINFYINPLTKLNYLCAAVTESYYGWGDIKKNEKIIVEYVSANPTGPLHVGHARQAVLGDAISKILSRVGYEIVREFYYNDAGNQIDNLGLSVWARLNGYDDTHKEFPPDGYRGDYINEIANDFKAVNNLNHITKFEKSEKLLGEIKEFSINFLREEQNADLGLLDVSFDSFALESSYYKNGLVEEVIDTLKKNGKTFFLDKALWLKSTDFGDDKDRVMIKSDGSYTYFVPDVAYHLDKWIRGFKKALNIQGSDHHGTLCRVKAGLQGLNKNISKEFPITILHKMVTVKKNGKDVKFSKRSGNYVTLKELIYLSSGLDERCILKEERRTNISTLLTKGKDAVRFFLLSKKPETEFNFDVDLAQKHSEENPVFYVQYAHARASSVIKQSCLSEQELLIYFKNLSEKSFTGEQPKKFNKAENDLVLRVLGFPEVARCVTENFEPHQLIFYLQDLASDFHKFYNDSKILVEDVWTKNTRLLIVFGIAKILKNNLELLGIDAPEKM